MAIMTIDFSNVIKAEKKLFLADSPLMKRLAITNLVQIDDRFEDSGFAPGQPWEHLKPETIRRRKNKNALQILVDTGVLRGSFSPFAGNNFQVSEIKDFEIITSSDVPYMDKNQFGFEGDVNIPAHIRKQKKRVGQKTKIVTKAITYRTKKGKTVRYRKKVKQKTKGRLVRTDVPVKAYKRFIVIPQRKILGFTNDNIREFIEVITDFLGG